MAFRDTLNLRARSESLPGSASASVAGTLTEILSATPCDEVSRNGAMWRTVDLWSNEGNPWDAQIIWSGGNAGQRNAWVTVANQTRLSIYASSIRVSGAARSPSPIVAWASITDGSSGNENEYSTSGSALAGGTTVDVRVPPFARYVRLELEDATGYAAATIQLIDGWGIVRNTTGGANQPSPGLPVGDTRIVRIAPPAGPWRVTFVLNI